MRAADQLDVAQHPTIRFASTRVVAEGDGRLRITGSLTLRGVTREVSFPACSSPKMPTLESSSTPTARLPSTWMTSLATDGNGWRWRGWRAMLLLLAAKTGGSTSSHG